MLSCLLYGRESRANLAEELGRDEIRVARVIKRAYVRARVGTTFEKSTAAHEKLTEHALPLLCDATRTLYLVGK